MDTRALAERIGPMLAGIGLECLGIEWATHGHGGTLRVYIEVAGREVDVDDCATASRELSTWLDAEDPIAGQYTLEISSPGIDRPLFTAAHFARLLGAEVRVTLKLPQQGRRRLRGRVLAVDDEQITVDVDTVPFTFAADAFESARLIPDWVALGYAPQPRQGAARDNSKPASRGKRTTGKPGTPSVSQ